MLVLRAHSPQPRVHTIYNIFSVCFSSQDNPLHEEGREKEIYLVLVELERLYLLFYNVNYGKAAGWAGLGLMQVSRKMIDETEARH